MSKATIKIRQIDNGWLYSVEGNGGAEIITRSSEPPAETYFKTLPEVLEHVRAEHLKAVELSKAT